MQRKIILYEKLDFKIIENNSAEPGKMMSIKIEKSSIFDTISIL